MSPNKKYLCESCSREITKEDYDNYDGLCWECWNDRLTEESDTMFGELIWGIKVWPCQCCGHENNEGVMVCENCGALRDYNISDSGDNRDSEDLFFDDEGI